MPPTQLKPAPITICIIAICAIIFIGLNMLGKEATFAQTARFGYFHPSEIWQGKPWVLITSAFVHFAIWHIFFNLYALWTFGSNVERDIGALPYAAFVVVSAWFSSSAQLFTGNSGIGISGVIYAIFGFAWLARAKMPHTGPYMHSGTVNQMLIWLVLFMVFTKLGWMNIGNAAHIGGLVFGMVVGALYTKKRRAALLMPVLALMLAASFVPLYYCPLSPEWTAAEAEKARDAKDYPRAIALFKRSISLGIDKKWAWSNIGQIYLNQGNEQGASEAVRELTKLQNSPTNEEQP